MRFNNTKIAYSTSLLGLIFLTGCGGGGSGGGSPAPSTPSTTTFPVASAVSAWAQASHSYTITAPDSGYTDTIQASFTPGASATFAGQTASTASEVINLSQNGALISTTSQTAYFIASPFTPLGTLDIGTGQYTVDANQVALPSTATVGQSGQYATETTYTNSAKTSVYSTTVKTWALNANTATTAWACINSVNIVQGNSAANSAGTTCYLMDTTGNISAIKLTVRVNAGTLTFQ